MTTPIKPGTALITGASAGIGAVYADRLAKRGHDLILVARNEARMNELAERLRRETGRTITVVKADLNARPDLLRVENILREDARISMLVNNAGVASAAPLLEGDMDELEGMIDLNVTALTRLTYAAVPGFVARGGGTVINISSVVAITPERLNGIYGASKAYVSALTQSLVHEVAGKGVRVQAVLPGATITDLWGNAGIDISGLPEGMFMTVDDMVDAALVGLDMGEVMTIPPLQDKTEWDAYEAARQVMAPKLSVSSPAPRYLKR